MMNFFIAEQFSFKSLEYKSLFQDSRATAFQSPVWLDNFYRHTAQMPGIKNIIILVRDSSTNDLLMVLPLLSRVESDKTRLEYASLDIVDYVCPVIKNSLVCDQSALNTIANGLRILLAAYTSLCIEPIRHEDIEVWYSILRITPIKLSFGRHEVRFNTNYENWERLVIGAKRLSQYRRKRRMLAGHGELIIQELSASQIVSAFEWARENRRNRIPCDPLDNSDLFRIYSSIAMEGAGTGLSATHALLRGQETVAVSFGIIDRNRFCYLLLACDYDRLGRHSPGILFFQMLMKQWAEGGGSVFDYTIGDEPYKQSLGCERYPMYSMNTL